MTGTDKPTLLLHACCAPCSPHVLDVLIESFRVTVLFYNPNIHPEEEYRMREKEIQTFARNKRIDLIVGDYEVSEWMNAIRGREQDPEGGERCRICFRFRLEHAARTASDRGIEYFTTTLSVSPHKNVKVINEEGNRAAEKFNVKFSEQNFKKKDGFKISCRLAEENGMYRQDYCGCSFSRRK